MNFTGMKSFLYDLYAVSDLSVNDIQISYNTAYIILLSSTVMNFYCIFECFTIFMMLHMVKGSQEILVDFTTIDNVNDWSEMSDTVRTVGMSKAVLALQTTQVFQRAIFFSLLNPQTNGAGFAGVRKRTNLNLLNFTNIEITCRGQGSNENYKIVLRHDGLHTNKDITYEQTFMAPMSSTTFSTVKLPLANFKAYYRGQEVPDAKPLDIGNITMLGLQVYGGVYSKIKQRGVSALEIENISVS